MSDLAVIAKIPGVRNAVMGDLEGTFLEASGDVDGEAMAAEMGLVATTLSAAGEALGLGTLRRVSAAGPVRASVMVLRASKVITASVEPARALPAVEKAVDKSFQGGI
jgi:predicted regulator of Ras-like GTPase activity (Roadblock/LC7/MglB family)